jgi:hypothetical protein
VQIPVAVVGNATLLKGLHCVGYDNYMSAYFMPVCNQQNLAQLCTLRLTRSIDILGLVLTVSFNNAFRAAGLCVW